jgi:transcriptional regulator with XRE-family HTH domain
LSRAEIKRFGEKLHALRIRHGLTLKELAQALEQTSHSYISELEAGKKIPTAEFVLNIALLFDVSTDLLLKDDHELFPEQDENRACNEESL